MISFENSEADAHGGFCDRGGLEIKYAVAIWAR